MCVQCIDYRHDTIYCCSFSLRVCIIRFLFKCYYQVQQQQHNNNNMWHSRENIPCMLISSPFDSSSSFRCQDRNDLFYLQLKFSEMPVCIYEWERRRRRRRLWLRLMIVTSTCFWTFACISFGNEWKELYILSKYTAAAAFCINKHKQPSYVQISHV